MTINEKFDKQLLELQKLSEELVDGKKPRMVNFGSKELVKTKDGDEIYTLPDWANVKKFINEEIEEIFKEIKTLSIDNGFDGVGYTRAIEDVINLKKKYLK